ncbi:MAG TPA: amidohydrolase family protein, partial [Pirellulaceae bacterium]|nr:amidohydrolase family protein [Pirellulaceae bacterium]
MRHADEVRRMLLLAQEFPAIRWVCEGLAGAGAEADTLRTARYPVVLGPWIGSERQTREVEKIWQQSLRDDGGKLVIATYASSGRGSRWLRAHAASAVAAGCDSDLALKAITLHAAEVLGIADQVGSIAPGKRADLTVFAGDPLDISAAVQLTLVNGQIVYESPRRPSGIAWAPTGEVVGELPDQWPAEFAITSPYVLLPNGQLAPRCLTIQHGKISRCEESMAPDNDLPVIDARGYVITPGLLLAHTTAGLTSSDYGTVESDARQLSAVDGFDPAHRDVKRLRAGGVLFAVVAPESRLTLAGRMGAVRLGNEIEVMHADVGDKIVLSGAARRTEQFPASLLGQIELVTAMLNGQSTGTRVYLPAPAQATLLSARQSEKQGLLEQQRWVLIEVGSDAEMRAALDVIERFGLRAALIGCRNIESFVDRLLATGTTLIVR